MTDTTTSNEAATANAAAYVESGRDVRERVRDLTLKLLTEHKLEAKGVHETLRSITEGIALGASRKPGEAKALLGAAFGGLDEALSKFAEASRLSLLELQSSGANFVEEDLKPALRRLVTLERDMLDAFSEAARSASAEAKRELEKLVEHGRRTGTDSGAVAGRTVADFSRRFAGLAAETATAGLTAGIELSSRMLQATLGTLDGIASALRKDSKPSS